MLPILQLLISYKWTILIGLSMFIFSILIISFNFWIALLVLIITVLGALIGFLIDQKVDVRSLFNKL